MGWMVPDVGIWLGVGICLLVATALVAQGLRQHRSAYAPRLAALRRRRLEAATPATARMGHGFETGLATSSNGLSAAWRAAVKLAGRPLKRLPERLLGGFRADLQVIGLTSDLALTGFLAAKTTAAVGTGLLSALACYVLPDLPDGPELVLSVFAAGVVLGALVPDALLKRRVRRRQHKLATQLPDGMDLLVICAEAGLTLESAISRVGTEIGFAAPELAAEFQRTAADMQIAPSRVDALESLAARTRVQEVRSAVATLVQAQKYGTPLGQSLRALSREFRTRRLRDVEERAGRLPSLMALPLVVFILPALLIIVIGPALLKALPALGS